MQIAFKCPKNMKIAQVAHLMAGHLYRGTYIPVHLGGGTYQLSPKGDYTMIDRGDSLALWYKYPEQERAARALVELFEASYCGD